MPGPLKLFTRKNVNLPPVIDDPYYDDVFLLSTLEGPESGTSFTDLIGHPVTNYGGVSTTTGQYPEGRSSSARFSSGVNGVQGLAFAAVAPLLQANDFTIEVWARSDRPYQTYGTSQSNILSNTNNGGSTGFFLSRWHNTAGRTRYAMSLQTNKGNAYTETSDSLAQSEANYDHQLWFHYAFERYGTTLRCYRQGAVFMATTLVAGAVATFTDGVPFTLGRDAGYPDKNFAGNMFGLRATIGVARYKGPFTPTTNYV